MRKKSNKRYLFVLAVIATLLGGITALGMMDLAPASTSQQIDIPTSSLLSE